MAADKEIMKAIERLRLDRPGRILAPAMSAAPTIGNIVTAGLSALATTYREEAELWSRSGAKGWKSSEAEKYLVAQHIDDVAAQLDTIGSTDSRPEPVGQTQAATTHERLDDFVSSAVAARKGTLHPPANDWPREADGSPAPGDASDVAAYLKGDVDTLPGLAEALVPNSITLGELLAGREVVDTVDGVPVFGPRTVGSLVGEQGPELITATGYPASSDPNVDQALTDRVFATPEISSTLLHDRTVPPTWESDTLTADGHMKPGVAQTLAPTLGQPGDMGTGYSHTYIPAGGRKVTYAELLTPVPVASLPPHLSHSQGNTIGDCATKYRLQRVEQLPQIPQWANIGGSAFHAAVEQLERMIAKTPVLRLDSIDVELNWKHHFEGQITAVAMTTPVPQSVWRAARKGAEGEQWWRVNGPLMLRRYLDARPDEHTALIGTDGTLAIELDLTVDVPTPYGPLPFNAKIDRVTHHAWQDGQNPGLMIRDYKTSYERPTDTTQLGDYANTLRLNGLNPEVRIFGSYFDARRGEWTEPVDLLAAHPFEAFQYRVTTAHAQKLALTTGPTPARPSSYCGGCAVRYACPVMAAKS